MATGGDLTLTPGDIEGLSEIITDKNMATIAIKYLRSQIKEPRGCDRIQQGYTGQVEEQNTGDSTGESTMQLLGGGDKGRLTLSKLQREKDQRINSKRI